jgi:hypothetical protein
MPWDTAPAKQPDPNATNLKRPMASGNQFEILPENFVQFI